MGVTFTASRHRLVTPSQHRSQLYCMFRQVGKDAMKQSYVKFSLYTLCLLYLFSGMQRGGGAQLMANCPNTFLVIATIHLHSLLSA